MGHLADGRRRGARLPIALVPVGLMLLSMAGPALAQQAAAPPSTPGADVNMGPVWPKLSAAQQDRKSTRLNSSHIQKSRMPSSA